MNSARCRKGSQGQSGQVWVIFAAVLPLFLVLGGLAIDFGKAYVTKTTLSKAVDAAALAAVKNLNLGQSQAITIATNAFDANFGANPPAVSITYTKDANNNTLANVSATATINALFIPLLTHTKTLSISSSAQATRNPLVMALVLDSSYSMTQNGGSTALAPAVDNFITHFDDAHDYVAVVNFATISSVPVALTQPFISKVQSAANSMQFGWGNPNGVATNSYAGMLNGQNQILSAPVTGSNVRKVAVFFTDGWANILQDNLVCSGTVATPWFYCGCDPGDKSLGLCDGVYFYAPGSPGSSTCCAKLSSGFGFGGCSDTVSTATFPSQQYNGPVTLYPAKDTGMDNCANEASYRTVQVANTMRGQNMIVYSIGLGSALNKTFLQQVANDPASPTFNTAAPAGEAVFAPTSGDLNSVFQAIASKVLLRLTQ